MFYGKILLFALFLSIIDINCLENEGKDELFVPKPENIPTISAVKPRLLPERIQKRIDLFRTCADSAYSPNDSSDTRWFDLSTGAESFFLIEDGHYCGNPSGSCGYRIMLIYETEDEPAQLVFEDCGSISEILRTAHNGMYDFKIQYRTFYREEPVFFRWTGKSVVEYEDPKPLNDTDAVFDLLNRYYSDEQFSRSFYEFDYVNPGNSEAVYVLVKSLGSAWLLRSVQSGQFEILNRFQNHSNISFCETKSRGFYDLETLDWNSYQSRHWKWNGKKYVPEKDPAGPPP